MYVLFLSILIISTGCKTDKNIDGVRGVDSENEEQQLGIINFSEDDAIEGFWEDGDYALYIYDTILFLQDKKTDYVNSFSYTLSKSTQNKCILSLGDLRENDSVSLVDPNSELTLTSDDIYLNVSGGSLKNRKFKSTDGAMLSDNFLEFIKSNGQVGQLPYQGEDLTLSDFTGYWAPFDKYAINDGVLSDLGNYSILLTENLLILAFPESEASLSYIHSYAIEGNSIEIQSEPILTDLFYSFTDGNSDLLEREIISLTFTLFKEEDRNRLVSHSLGGILQAVSEDEILDATGSLYGDKLISLGQSQIDILNSIPEEKYTITKPDLGNNDLTVNNYPYSVGDLSEITLYKEQQIINGLIEHEETDINEEDAINQLVSGDFESTPTYNNLKIVDNGYYFDEFGVTIGQGGRTYWSSGPLYLEILDIKYENHIYTVRYKNTQTQEEEIERYYRINKNVIYKEDMEGKFSKRYAKNTEWTDFHGLPDRKEKKKISNDAIKIQKN